MDLEKLQYARDVGATHVGNISGELYVVHSDWKVERHNGIGWEYAGHADQFGLTKIDFTPLEDDEFELSDEMLNYAKNAKATHYYKKGDTLLFLKESWIHDWKFYKYKKWWSCHILCMDIDPILIDYSPLNGH